MPGYIHDTVNKTLMLFTASDKHRLFPVVTANQLIGKHLTI